MTKIKDIPSWLFRCDDGLKKYAPKTPPVQVAEPKKETEPVKVKQPTKKPVKKPIVYSSEESEEEVVKKKKKSKKAKAVSTDEDSFSEGSSDEDF